MAQAQKTMQALHLTDHSKGNIALSMTTPVPGPSTRGYVIRVHCTAITTAELTWPSVTSCSSPIPGHDHSGTVVSAPTAASGMATFKPGDEVFALTAFNRDGSAAEYVYASEQELARKPSNVSYEQAACIPLSALTAWQAFYTHGKLRTNSNVLILGATGGVGVMAVQIAKHYTAHGGKVSATCGTKNMDFVRNLGADEVFDYSQGSRGLEGKKFDFILDTVGGGWQSDAWEWVEDGGWLISVHSPLDEGKQRKKASRVKSLYFIVEPDAVALGEIADLVEQGKLRGIVDSIFPLEEGVKAFEKLNGGHVRGKVVLKVANS